MSREYQVSTWQELTERLSNQSDPYSDYPIYITLMADIDMNEVAPSGVGTTPVYTVTSQYTKVLNMNGHSIKNLRTNITNPQPIFTDDNPYNNGASFMIVNGDFVNLICAGNHFISFHNQSSSSIALDNVRFVGYRTGTSYLLNKEDRITCTSCYFDMPWYGAGSSTYDYTSLVKRGTPTTNIPTANYCWFHESYGGWTLTDGSGQAPASDYPTTQGCMFAMNGCYSDGEMNRSISVYYNGASAYFTAKCDVMATHVLENYTASTPNVVDMKWIVNTTQSSDYTPSVTFEFYNLNGVIHKNGKFTGPKIPSTLDYSRAAVGSQPNSILATSEQMQDINWLRSQGFPIVEDTPTE